MHLLKNNFRTVLLLCASALLITSCKNYGKKIVAEGTKGEVYYKGDGVTETDAKKVGEFLKKDGYFDDQRKTVQIRKEDSAYMVRMVVDEEKVKKIPDVEKVFKLYGAMLSREVFDSKPVTIITCDEKMNDLQTFAFDRSLLESPLAKMQEEIKAMSEKKYEGNSLYYDKSIQPEEADHLMEYFKEKSFFIASGNNDIIVNKGEGESARFRFPINDSFNTEEGLAQIDAFVKQMKEDLFGSFPVTFEVLDSQMNVVKTFSY